MTTAYSYIRFSSVIQAKGDSLRRQTQLAQDYCNKHSLTLSDQSFTDLGVSAFRSANTNDDNGLGQFLAAMEQGVIPKGSYLLVESLDRLSRASVEDAQHQLLTIIRMGIVVVTLLDNKKYQTGSPSLMVDLVISLTIMQRAHEESETKSQRIKAAWANKRANPHTTNRTSLAPFWLKLNEDKRSYTVIEKNAETVRRIFQMSIDGHGIIGIARRLNEEKIPSPKGGSWANTSISRILNSKAVIGEYTPNIGRTSTNAPISDYYPSIIDEDTFYLSQSRKAERTKPESAGRKTTFPNLFNQVAKCGLCGSTMYYDNKSPSLKYLTCREFKKKNCINKPIRIELMNRFIVERFLSPAHFERFNELATKKTTTLDNDVTILESQLEAAKEAYKQLLELSSNFSDTVIQDEIKRRSESVKSLTKQIETAKLQSIETPNSVYMDFRESCQLVANALQQEVYGKKPETLSEANLITSRTRLNRTLKNTFKRLLVTHNPETRKASITTEDFTYEANNSAMKTGFNKHTWTITN